MNTKPKLGDLLYRSKGFVQHAGVYIGEERVLHNGPDGGVEVVSYNTYSQGKTVNVVSSDQHNICELKQRLQQITQGDTRYQWFSNNCEHIANFMISGRKYSPQIQASAIGAIIGAITGQSKGGYNWLLFALIGGIAGCALSNSLRNYDFRISSALTTTV